MLGKINELTVTSARTTSLCGTLLTSTEQNLTLHRLVMKKKRNLDFIRVTQQNRNVGYTPRMIIGCQFFKFWLQKDALSAPARHPTYRNTSYSQPKQCINRSKQETDYVQKLTTQAMQKRYLSNSSYNHFKNSWKYFSF